MFYFFNGYIDITKPIFLIGKSFPKLPIYIVGHSSGANIGTMASVDPSYLKAFGYSNKIITGVVSIDGPGFNLWKSLIK